MKSNDIVRSSAVPRLFKNVESIPEDAFAPSEEPNPFAPAEKTLHRYGVRKEKICLTEGRGHATPGNVDLREIRVDSSEGFIPLWKSGSILHYRFNARSMRYFRDVAKAKAAILTLFSEAVHAWGDAAPVRFAENEDTYDFEIYMNPVDDGDDNSGYVLASAFFPSSGRDQLTLYPKMFTQRREEQVETLIHEIGHIFGLRHFFAADLESKWPSELFGKDDKFTIMNYGADSVLSDADKADLKRLYTEVWAGRLVAINGTSIVQVKPYHNLP